MIMVSQNKEVVVNSNSVVLSVTEDGRIGAYPIDMNLGEKHWYLGKYDTKEKAKVEMDLIIRALGNERIIYKLGEV